MTGAHVMTVAGPIAPTELGRTLVHEHLSMEFPGFGADPSKTKAKPLTAATAAEARWNPLDFPDSGRFTDIDLIVGELADFRAAGGQTIVDLTPIVLSRSPEALLEISRRAGIHVIMGGGYFTEPFHPKGLAARKSEELAEEFIREIREGVGSSGIRPGILGEVGAGDPFTEAEVRLLRASAWAQRETGVAISVHLQALGRAGPAVLDVLEKEGVPPDRIILGHMTPMIGDDAYQRSLLDRGVYLAYDYLGLDHAVYFPGRYLPNDYDVAVKIAELVKDGHPDQILLSHDIGELIRLKAYGGWGFSHILDHILPLLLRLGVEESQVDQMICVNPARVLTVHQPV